MSHNPQPTPAPQAANTQAATTAATQSLAQRDRQAIWHPFTPVLGSPEVLAVQKAHMEFLITEDGRQIIDAIGSWWVNLHGHSHPHIAQAIAQQAASLEHVIFAGFTHQPAVQLAEGLLNILPQNQHKVFYSDNGSTAVEVALKMAMQYWHNQGLERPVVVAMDGAYHGDTFGAMSVGDRGAFTAPFENYLFEVAFLPFPTPQQEQAVWQQFKTLVEGGRVGAFIFEPLVQGAAGMRMYSKALLSRMVGLAQQHGVLCIADEVMTGFGRTGKLFASQHLDHMPDIFCLSKGLTGGSMAMGATTCTKEVFRVFETAEMMKTFFHGHSFTANPIACAAAVASLELLQMPQTQAHMQRVQQEHAAFAQKIAQHPNAQNVRQLGTIVALEVASFNETGYFNEARHQLYPFFIERNVLLRPLGNVLYVLPPYTISTASLHKVYNAIEALLNTWQRHEA